MENSSSNYGLLRLKSKDAHGAIVQKLSNDINLTPIIAEAYYQQFSQYYQEHDNVTLSSGEVAYEAVASDETAGICAFTRVCTLLPRTSYTFRRTWAP